MYHEFEDFFFIVLVFLCIIAIVIEPTVFLLVLFVWFCHAVYKNNKTKLK
jgi:hypothetical protein